MRQPSVTDITGTVRKDTVAGAGMPGVSVRAYSEPMGEYLEASTDANGAYSLGGLSPGVYKLLFDTAATTCSTPPPSISPNGMTIHPRSRRGPWIAISSSGAVQVVDAVLENTGGGIDGDSHRPWRRAAGGHHRLPPERVVGGGRGRSQLCGSRGNRRGRPLLDYRPRAGRLQDPFLRRRIQREQRRHGLRQSLDPAARSSTKGRLQPSTRSFMPAGRSPGVSPARANFPSRIFMSSFLPRMVSGWVTRERTATGNTART